MSLKAIPSILDKITTLKDGGAKVVFETQELTEGVMSDLFKMRNKLGWLFFAPEGVNEVEIPEDPPTEFKEDKTPSQRLRAVLYLYWKKLGGIGDFTDF